MEQQCRFCLDEESTNENPLLLPCECKGSVAYVHKICLYRWRSLNPVKNGRVCQLCKTDYNDYIFVMEITEIQGFQITILQYPFLLSFLLHGSIVAADYAYPSSYLHHIYPSFFPVIYHMIYFILFSRNWFVRHRLEYWLIFKKKYFYIPILNLYVLIIASQVPGVLLIVDFFLYTYWSIHISILKELNCQILLNPAF